MGGPVSYPLTFGQEQLLDLGRVGGQHVLVRSMGIPIESGVSVPHLTTALRRVVRRHDALRMYAAGTDGTAQSVAPARDVELIPADGDAGAYGALDLWTDPDRPLMFSIDETAYPPMMRLYLHHAFVDGWSCALIMSDFYREYAALLGNGRTVATPAGSFGHYAREQRRRVTGRLVEAHNAFWADELRDAPPLALPYATGTWRPGVHAGRLPTLGFEVTGCSMARLKERLPELGHSGAAAIQAAFAAALTEATGQRDLVVHITLADRGTSQKRGLVGCLVNRVTLRLRLPPDLSARRLVLAVRAAWARAARHQVGPFQRDGRHTDAGRILNLTPRVAVVVNDALLPVQNYSTVGRPERRENVRHNEFCTIWDTALDCGDDLLLSVLPRRPDMGSAEAPVRFAMSYRPDLWTREGVETLGTRVARWLVRLP